MSTSRPTVHPTADRAYADLGPLTRGDDEGGWLLLRLLAAALLPLDEIETLARDRDDRPGWSTIVDLDQTPGRWLPWLAQFVGVEIPGGLSDLGRRNAVRDQAASRRGTPASITGAVRSTLAGSRRVDFIERDGSPYRLTVRVYEAEVIDLDVTRAALEAQKPGPIVASVDVQPGATYDDLAADFATYSDVIARFDDYDSMRAYVPGEG